MPDSSPDTGTLPCRSQRRGKEWALALLSQGIESELLLSPQGWILLLNPALIPRAREIIRLYQKENRHWHRYFQATPDNHGFHPAALLWTLLVAALYTITSFTPESITNAGLCSTGGLLAGEYQRLFTAISLHANLAHLLGNLIFGTLLLGYAMARFGGGWTLLSTFLSGAAANILSAWIHGPNHHGLGASGMVMAALGLLAISLPPPSAHPNTWQRWLLRGILAAGLLFVLIGLDPSTDVIAHSVGFLAGILSGLILRVLPHQVLHSNRPNHYAAILALTLLLATWALALAQS
ncbi:MAG: rhomboid family intramembrane serine protease [Limisphaerales bacterium]